MLTFEQMFARFVAALVLGAILGIEREIVGKEAGVRTEMLVAGGAAIFSMIGLSVPAIIATMYGGTIDSQNLVTAVAGVAVIANVVVGVGFLGAGLIIKLNDHPRGITTAALVWLTASIGVLVGIGLVPFAALATILIALSLYVLRKLDVSERLERRAEKTPEER